MADLAKPSVSIIKECKKLKLEIPQKAFADLKLAGWSDKDAYIFSGLYSNLYSESVNKRDMERLLHENKNLQDYLDKKIKEQEKKMAEAQAKVSEASQALSDDDIEAELSKENQIKELLIAKAKHPVGSKEWLDIKKMIADLTQIKKDEIKDEDEFVHFYVPISCASCELYEAAKRKLNKVK